MRHRQELQVRGLFRPPAQYGTAWALKHTLSSHYPRLGVLSGSLHEYIGHECLKSSLAFRKPAVAAASRRPARADGPEVGLDGPATLQASAPGELRGAPSARYPRAPVFHPLSSAPLATLPQHTCLHVLCPYLLRPPCTLFLTCFVPCFLCH